MSYLGVGGDEECDTSMPGMPASPVADKVASTAMVAAGQVADKPAASPGTSAASHEADAATVTTPSGAAAIAAAGASTGMGPFGYLCWGAAAWAVYKVLK